MPATPNCEASWKHKVKSLAVCAPRRNHTITTSSDLEEQLAAKDDRVESLTNELKERQSECTRAFGKPTV